MVQKIGQDEFEAFINNHRIVIVDFSAEWCGPCKNLGKLLEDNVAPKIAGRAELVNIDIDENQDLAQGLQINSVPTMMFFFNGKRIVFEGNEGSENQDRITGYHPQIGQLIETIVDELENTPDPTD
jgi:thioredoxin-like negative regulator of GroEL